MFFELLFGSSIFSIRSRSFCLLFAWPAFFALARFFSINRSSCAAALGVGLGLAGELLVAGRFLPDVAAVVAGVADELPVFELHDGARHRVQEVAVVGDDQNSGLRVLYKAFQPLYRPEIQVVGRLVEQNQVRLLQQ